MRTVAYRRDRPLEEHSQVGEIPFSSARMLMATFHQTQGGLTRT